MEVKTEKYHADSFCKFLGIKLFFWVTKILSNLQLHGIKMSVSVREKKRKENYDRSTLNLSKE